MKRKHFRETQIIKTLKSPVAEIKVADLLDIIEKTLLLLVPWVWQHRNVKDRAHAGSLR